MRLDLSSKRAKKLMEEHELTEDEILQIVASARINLATFDPEYRTNVTHYRPLFTHCGISAPGGHQKSASD
jgi:hypothetical protein